MRGSPRISLLGLLLVLGAVYGSWIAISAARPISADSCKGYAICR